MPAAVTVCGMGDAPDDMMSAVSASLAERTGRPLAEWIALVQATHKVSLHSVADLDDEVRHLLRAAYEQNA
jgi:hypothetical protein